MRKSDDEKLVPVLFSLQELYAIEREFDRLYSALLMRMINMDRNRVELEVFMEPGPEKEELKTRLKSAQATIEPSFLLYRKISDKCEAVRLDE